MHKILLLLLLPLFISAQSDTITVDGNRTLTGTTIKLYEDRLTFKDNSGVEYVIMRDRMSSKSILTNTTHNGLWGKEYVHDPRVLFTGVLPEFKDRNYYLTGAGIYGITGSTLIVGGGIIAGIGQYLRNTAYNSASQYQQGSSVALVGSIMGSVGTAMLIPTFVYLFKAGKVKSYRVP